MVAPTDEELAARYGAYASFQTASGPVETRYYGEDPTEELVRLLHLHAHSESRVLDLGCGAGWTLCRLAPGVREIWGVDLAGDLLLSAARRASAADLTNVTFIEGDTTDPTTAARLPDAHFDLAFSQRGPHLNRALVGKLRDDGIFIQDLVSEFNGYPLREIFGRQHFIPQPTGHYGPFAVYAELGLFPVSAREYFYDEFYRDPEHLAASLSVGATLSNWRLDLRPYDEARDRAALDLYARYNTTPAGIRVLRHRRILVVRRAPVHYYPVDATGA